MERKDYLINRFKKDFLQYCLLQEDSLSAEKIADRLYSVVDLTKNVAQSKTEIQVLLDKYFPFEKVMVKGNLSNVLSADLDYGLKDQIIAEYDTYLDNSFSKEMIIDIISKIRRSIELQTWRNGIVNMSQAVMLFAERLNNSSKSYGCLYTTPMSEERILDKFKKAKENTLLERIRGNNIDDIIEYRNALIEYVKAVCENMLYARLKDIYARITNDNIFKQLSAHFDYLSEYAVRLKSTIVDYSANPVWDHEYNHIVPTDFYFRNVEDITAKQAFHMILLQFFAKNEDWMKEKGMLQNGEICVYLQSENSLVDQLLYTLSENLF